LASNAFGVVAMLDANLFVSTAKWTSGSASEPSRVISPPTSPVNGETSLQLHG
jgi:hypothetical protein